MSNFYPLSSEQLLLWIDAQRTKETSHLNMHVFYKITGKLKIVHFKNIVEKALDEETVLNLVFKVSQGIPYYIYSTNGQHQLQIINFKDIEKIKTGTQEVKYIKNKAKHPLNLLFQPNYQITLYISNKPETYYLSFILPNVLVDAYSSTLFFNKIAKLYNQAHHDDDSILLKKSAQLIPDNTNNSETKKYWIDKLLKCEPSLNNDLIFSPPSKLKRKNFLCQYLELDKNHYQTLSILGRQLKTTPFMIMMCTFMIVLYKYTRQTKLSCLYPVNIRNLEQKQTAGYFVNLLPMNFMLLDNKTLKNLIIDTTAQRKLDKSYQSYPYSSIRKIAKQEKHEDFNILFSHSSILLPHFSLEGLEVDAILPSSGHVQSGTSLLYDVNDKDFILCLEFNVQQFPYWLMHQLLHNIGYIIKNITKYIDTPVKKFSLYSDTQKDNASTISKKSSIKNINTLPIITKLNRITYQYPNNVAIIDGHRKLTYKLLHQEIMTVALNLHNNGISTKARVIILLGRTYHYIIIMFALLQLRCTFIPIDPNNPLNRINYIVKDSDARFIITSEQFKDNLVSSDATILNIKDLTKPAIEKLLPDLQSNTNDIMYIIYTSGTTGKPKGVPIEYVSIDHLFTVTDSYFDFRLTDAWCLLHSFAFDFAIWEIFGALIHGARLIIMPDDIRMNALSVYKFVIKYKVSILNITPSAFKNFSLIDSERNAPLSLRYVIFGGEKLLFTDVKKWLERHGETQPKLINMYGLTEAPIHATYHKITERDENKGTSLIGKPLDGLHAYVVDENGNRLPPGVYGELWLSSPFITKGYLHLNQLNKEKFIASPFSDSNQNRIYKTGDYVCRLPNGDFDYLDRYDKQIQLNGYRIELGEIDQMLQKMFYINSAVSIIYKTQSQHDCIITFCTPVFSQHLEKEAIEYLKDNLPYYMLPAQIIFIEAIPVTLQGKVDSKALEKMIKNSKNDPISVNLDKELIQMIADIWRKLLGIDEIDINKNFFEQGGDSINLLTLHSELEKLIRKRFDFNILFKETTVQKQALYFSRNKNQYSKNKNLPVKGEKQQATENNIIGSIQHNEPIAVIGISLDFPGATSIEEFWHNLKTGKETISYFQPENHINEISPSNEHYVYAKGCITDAKYFDANFFGYSQHKAELLDPQHRKLLECSWSALEDSGYIDEDAAGRISVFVGQSNINSYSQQYHTNQNESASTSQRYQTLIYNSPDFLATRIAYKLNLTGPAITLQTGCSTSLVAITQAIKSLKNQECDMAIAGGVSITYPLKAPYVYETGMILSPNGHCSPFDSSANGIVPGNGLGIVILKRYSEAIQENDHIYALIKSAEINNDGNQKIGYTAPSEIGQINVIKRTLKSANVTPDTIDYIETHGTGTALGDPIEISALNSIMHNYARNYPAILGSVKANIGHLDAASGVAGLIKTILCLHNKTFTPQINFKKLNPKIKFEQDNFEIITKSKEWEKRRHPRRASVTSLGIGGTNVGIVLEEHNTEEKRDQNKCRHHLFILSAKSEKSFLDICKKYKLYFENKEHKISLCDVSATLQLGRKHFNHRFFLVADKQTVLSKLLDNPKNINVLNDEPKGLKICFLFSGQGGKPIKSLSNLYQTMPTFKQEVLICIEKLQKINTIDLSELFSLEPPDSDQPKIEFNNVNQLYIFIIQYALAKQWLAWNVHPDALCGHSLGEYIAACLAGVWSLDDSLRIISKRQELCNKLPKGSMIATTLHADELQHYEIDNLSIAAINSDNRCTISGSDIDIDNLCLQLNKNGIHYSKLTVEHAYHSELVQTVQKPLSNYIAQFNTNKAKIPFINNVTGALHSTKQQVNTDHWAQQIRRTVLFSDGIDTLIQNKITLFIELSPGKTLATFVRQKRADVRCYTPYSYKNSDISEIGYLDVVGKLWQSGIAIDWRKFNESHHYRRISLPTYAFEKKRHWPKTENKKIIETRMDNNPNIFIYQPAWRRQVLNNHQPSIKNTKKTYILFSLEKKMATSFIRDFTKEVEFHIDCFSIDQLSYENIQFILERFKHHKELHILYFYPDSEFQINKAKPDDKFTNFKNYLFTLKTISNTYKGKLYFNVVIENMFHIIPSDRLNPLSSLILGPALTVKNELKNVKHYIIDINFSNKFHSIDNPILPMLNELKCSTRPKIVAYRDNNRFVRCFNSISFDQQSVSTLRDRGVYIVTGGFGHIGLAITKFIVTEYKANIILLSRRSITDLKDNNTVKQLDELKKQCQSLLTYQVDVADKTALKTVFDKIEARYGNINGIIHAAGNKFMQPIVDLNIKEMSAHLSTKIDGAINLHELTYKYNLDFTLYCSALSIFTGDYGQSLYNSANAFLDMFAKWRTIHYSNTVSINWDTWNDGGMALPFLKEWKFTSGLKTQEALANLVDIISQQYSQLIISKQAIHARLKQTITSDFVEEKFLEHNHTDTNTKMRIQNKKSDIEADLRCLWSTYLNYEPISTITDFNQLGGDSLLALQLTSILSKKYNIKLQPHTIIQYPTIKTLASYLSKKINTAEAKETKEEAFCLVELNKISTHQPNIFLIHPVGGTVYIYRDFANSLEGIANVYGIQAKALDGISKPETSIEELANYYIKFIKIIQPNGNYLVGGASFGGTVAYEIAQQLYKLGDAVSLLFQIDTPSHNNQPKPFFSDSEVLQYLLEVGFQHKPIPAFQCYGHKKKIDYFLANAGGIGKIIPEFSYEHLTLYLRLCHANINAMLTYKANPLSQPQLMLNFYRAKQRDHINPHHPEIGWQTLLNKRVHIKSIPGNHITMLFSPNVDIITANIKQLIHKILLK